LKKQSARCPSDFSGAALPIFNKDYWRRFMRIKAGFFPSGPAVLLLAVEALSWSNESAAAEGYRLRQAALPVLGGEMAADLEQIGFFGTVAVGYLDSYKVVDDQGHHISVPGQSIALPTGAATGGAIPDGTYNVDVGPAAIDYRQLSQQYRFIIGYLFDTGVEGNRLGVSLSRAYQRMDREVSISQQTVQLRPQPAPSLPPPLQAALNTSLNRVATQVAATQQTELDAQNREVGGLSDSVFAFFFTRTSADRRFRYGIDLAVAIPDGEYRSDRAPNPSLNYYTSRLETAMVYSFGPQSYDSFSGITIGNRTGYGWNTINKDTEIRTGQFFNTEFAIEKVIGRFAFGLNAVALIQTTDDSGSGAPERSFRLRTYSGGPFAAIRLTERAGINISYADTFYARNAQVSRGVALRLIRSW